MIRRCGGVAVLVGLAAMLAGCVYDPYTGAYYPCCAYPYQPYAAPYYRAPGYGYPAYRAPGYGYPAPPGYQPGPPR
jgi:hypothetical protein